MKNLIKKLKLTIAFLFCLIMVFGHFYNVSHAASNLDVQWSLNSNDRITFTWSPIDGAVRYYLLVQDTVEKVAFAYESNLTTTSFTCIYYIPPGNNYKVTVAAYSSVGAEITSQSKSFSIGSSYYDKPPGVPGNINSTSTSTSATVGWSAVSGATGYDLLFNGATYSVTDTSKTFYGLLPKTSYSYSVRAKNASYVGEYSTTRTVMTLPTPLAIPANVTATVTATSITVSWSTVTGATSYGVYFQGASYIVTGTSRTFNGLSPDTSYEYAVYAKNEDVTSLWVTKTATTLPNPPTVPTNVTATATVNSATVSWSAVSGATSYDVQFNGNTYNVTGTSKEITALSPNTSYTYSVRANNGGGSSAYSTSKTVTTLPTAPTVPTNITATATADSVTVSWSEVSGATSYDVLFNGNTYNVTGTSRTITGLSPSTSYTYQVRANNGGGSSAYSTSKAVTTLPNPPTVPTNVTATATVNSATVSWSAVSGATSYDVLFNGATYNVTGTFRSFSGLSSDTNYTYSVRANNTGGSSSYSASKIITTLPGPPAVPADVSVATTENSATVSWSPVSGATNYDVTFNGVTRNVTGTSETFTGLSPNTGYTYSVRANNAGGSSAYSTTKTAKTTPNPPAGVNLTATENSVSISWSPVTGATGYTVLFNGATHSVTGTSITITELSPGTGYTYSIRTNNADGSSSYLALQTVKTRSNPPADISTYPSASSVTVSWSPISGATSYDILFGGTEYNVTDTSKAFTGLSPDKDYTYAVRANNESGPGKYGPTNTVRTLPEPPAVPSNVSARSTLNDMTISWPAVDKATSYDVNFNGKTANVTGTSTTFSGLAPNTTHSYSVRANNQGGSSGYSPTQTFSTKNSQTSGLPNTKQNQTYPDGKVPHLGLDPVNALNGAFLWSYTCLEDYGKDPLDFTVMYDSKRDGFHQILGNKWTYSLNYLLQMEGDYAYFSTPYGEVVPFRIDRANDTWQSAEGIPTDYQMGRKADQSYFVKDIDGVEYIFTTNLILSKIMENGLATYSFNADGKGQITGITGRHGRSLTLEYTDGHISRVADTMEKSIIFTYDGDYLTGIMNPQGDSMLFTYDGSGRLLTIKDLAGKSYISNHYDYQGRVIKQSLSGRGTTLASYDDENRETTFTDELGNTTKYSYDENLWVTSVELAGSDIRNEYNNRGQITMQTDALGNTTEMVYDEFGRLSLISYPDHSQERILYNSRNYPVKIINRDNTEVIYEYDARNNLTSLRDERGKTETFTYDSHDNLISHTDKNGYVSAYTYDENDHLKTHTDPEGNIHRYSYDAIGRLRSYTSPAGRTITYTYSAAGDLLRMTDGDGTVLYDYDENGNPIEITDRLGNKQQLEYNGMGQVSLETDFQGNEYRFTYDQRGDLTRETDPLGYSQSYTYDALGNMISWTDGNGNTTAYTYDAINQLTEIKDAAGNATLYTYDKMGQIRTVTDPLNHQTSYSYDYMGRLTGMTDALGHSTGFTYDEAGNLLTQTNANGTVTTYSYDNDNRLKTITTDAGTISFTYDKLGRLTSMKDTDGHAEKAGYDPDGNQTSVTDKESNKTTYAYDSSGRLSQETDPNGKQTKYEYDKNGNCTRITDAAGNAYSYQYDEDSQLTKATDPLGHTTAYAYDARGNLESVTDARGGKTTFEYDGNGNLIQETNPVGGVRTYSYDSADHLTGIKDENGYSQSFTYDANGNLVAYTDANQNSWAYQYDAIGQLTDVAGQDGGHITLSYSKMGEVTKITDQEGAETTYRYDSLGRLTGMSDALGNSLSWTYDNQDRVISQTDGAGNETQYTYSPAGNLLSITEPESSSINYTYNALGQVLTETDALGSVTSYTYDALGQVTAITDALGGRTAFTYTAAGEIAAVTDAAGGLTTYQYDANGNLAQTTDPLGTTVAYEYDAMNNQIREYVPTSGGVQAYATIYQYDKKGQMVREINPLSQEKSYSYDGNGNIIKVADEDGYETIIRYDLNNNPTAMCYSDGREALFRYNKRGELVELKDWNGTTTMEYGSTGRLNKVTDHNGRTTGYSYDAGGNLTGITYPGGSVVNYAYDRNNRLVTVSDAEDQITGYEYDPAGNILGISQPNGSTTTYTYNAASQPTHVLYKMGDGTSMEDSLAYDALGNIVSSVRKGSTPELTRSRAYSYDATGQLLSYTDGLTTESYSYDRLGNMTGRRVNGNQEASYQYNGANQLTTRMENGATYSYQYDRRGNLTEEKRDGNPIRQYTYDATNHLTAGQNIETGENTEYTYNGLFMRVKNVQRLEPTDGGYQSYAVLTEEDEQSPILPDGGNQPNPYQTREVSYVIDYLSNTNNELLTIEEGYGTTLITYGHGSQRLSQNVTPAADAPEQIRAAIATNKIGKSYFQTDLLGSVLFATNQSGEVLRYAERDVWGNLRIPVPGDMNSAGVENSLLFTNHSYDPVIDKYFAQARFYDAGTGRMLARDPVKTGLNLYSYCWSNPVNYTDPDGEMPGPLIGALGETFIGSVFRGTDYIARQKEAGKKVNPLELVKETLTGAKNGFIQGLTSSLNPVTAISQMVGIVGNMAIRAVHDKVTNGKIDIGKISREVLYDRYGGRPKPTQPVRMPGTAGTPASAAENTKAAVRPATKPSVEPTRSQRDPKTSCGATGGGSGYGYNSGTSGPIRTTPSLLGNLKERWTDPNTMVRDLSTAATLIGIGGHGIYKAGKAISTFAKNRNMIANAARVSQGRLPMNLQFFGGKSGSQSNPAALARSWQGSGDYPGIDKWSNVTLKKDAVVWGGSPGQSNFYVPDAVMSTVGTDATRLYQGIQVGKGSYPSYRAGMTMYQVIDDTTVGFAKTLANPQHGAGGFDQYFIDKYQDVLKPIMTRIMTNR